MKEISISTLRRMSAKDIQDGGCFGLIADGEQVAIVIVGAIGEMKDKITTQASQIDIMRGQ